MPAKRDYRYFKDVERERLLNIALDFWKEQEYELKKIDERIIHGSKKMKWRGYYLDFVLSTGENRGQIYIDLLIRSNLTDLGQVDRATDYAFFGLVGGAASNIIDDHHIDNEISRLMDNFWRHITRNLERKNI